MSVTRRVVLLGLCALLGACGFHLRDEVKLPASLATVSVVSADTFSPLLRDLRDALKRAGATTLAEPRDGTASVRLLVDQLTTEVLTTSGRARVTEYIIRYKVDLEVVDGAGVVLLPRATIELTRDFSFDETQALGAAAEDELLRKELRREMVVQLLSRIESIR
jgi:LPS-assembly lipoprotein